MKTWTLAAAVFVCTAAVAQTAPTARKPCDDLKTEIAKKLDAKNVVGYSLDIVDKGKESQDGRVVGSCDGGTKSVVYSKNIVPGKTAPAVAQSADAKKPQ